MRYFSKRFTVLGVRKIHSAKLQQALYSNC